MKFEIYRGNRLTMWTEYESCIPPDETLRKMAQSGYRFKKNDKAWDPDKQINHQTSSKNKTKTEQLRIEL